MPYSDEEPGTLAQEFEQVWADEATQLGYNVEVTVTYGAGHSFTDEVIPGDRADLAATIAANVAGLNGVAEADIRLEFGRTRFAAVTRWNGSQIVLRFPDGSSTVVDPPLDLDEGAALLDPITHAEFIGVERIIGELFRVAGQGGLSADDEQRVLALARLILWERQQTSVDETPRWRVVGSVRSVLLHIVQDIPAAIVATEISLLLHSIGWTNLAHAVLP